MNRWLRIAALSLFTIAPSVAGEQELSGSVGAELRWFVESPALPDQLQDTQPSLIAAPEFRWNFSDGRHQLQIAPFLRLDAEDGDRTHFDLRQAYWRYIADDWELLVGIDKVFWGVTESRHLVDIINQTDSVEDIDDEDKLGQPMLNLAFQRDWGRVDLFVLPTFRERTFPGADGRLRFALPVDEDRARYESRAEEGHVDLAARYSHYFGNFDLGASYFYGTSREPLLTPRADGQALVPFYSLIHQFGLDVQYTGGAWLWKLEAIGREGQGSTFAAAVAGFEYTFYQLGKSSADLGLLAEYLWDDRDLTAAPATALDDDLFLGSRLALNDTQDTEILLGAVVDAHDGSISGLLEVERRLGSRLNLEVESRWFAAVDAGNPLQSFEKDSFVTTRLSFHF